MVLHHLDTISRRSKTVDITIYGILEQNRTNNAAFLVGRICHDFSSQVMYHAHHLGIILVVLVRDTICGQSFRAGATTLVEGRNEAVTIGHLLQLFLLHGIASHLARGRASREFPMTSQWARNGVPCEGCRRLSRHARPE